jgi:hypothetical protein
VTPPKARSVHSTGESAPGDGGGAAKVKAVPSTTKNKMKATAPIFVIRCIEIV